MPTPEPSAEMIRAGAFQGASRIYQDSEVRNIWLEMETTRAKTATQPADFKAWWDSDPERARFRPKTIASEAWQAALAQQSQDAALQALSDSGQEIENLELAQNYRWLRDRATWVDPFKASGDMVWCVIGTDLSNCRPCEGAELDAVIALARAADAASR